eukprot:1073273_1
MVPAFLTLWSLSLLYVISNASPSLERIESDDPKSLSFILVNYDSYMFIRDDPVSLHWFIRVFEKMHDTGIEEGSWRMRVFTLDPEHDLHVRRQPKPDLTVQYTITIAAETIKSKIHRDLLTKDNRFFLNMQARASHHHDHILARTELHPSEFMYEGRGNDTTDGRSYSGACLSGISSIYDAWEIGRTIEIIGSTCEEG